MSGAPEGEQSSLEQATDRFYVRFNEIAADLRGRDPESITESEYDDLTNELDGLWPYDGELCYVAGNGVYPLFDDEGVQYGETYGRIDGVVARSRGVTLRKLPGSEHVQPYHCLIQCVENKWEMNTKQTCNTSHIFLEGTGSVIPKRLVDEVYHDEVRGVVKISADFDKNLRNFSSWFDAKLHSRTFRRWPQAKQAQFIDNFLGFCEEKFPLRRVSTEFIGAYCLRPVISLQQPDNQLTDPTADAVGYDHLALNGQPAGGVIMGFSSPVRSVVSTRPIRRNNDMHDPKAGLCLNIEVSEQQTELPLRPGEVILLPLSSQAVDLTFYSGS